MEILKSFVSINLIFVTGGCALQANLPPAMSENEAPLSITSYSSLQSSNNSIRVNASALMRKGDYCFQVQVAEKSKGREYGVINKHDFPSKNIEIEYAIEIPSINYRKVKNLGRFGEAKMFMNYSNSYYFSFENIPVKAIPNYRAEVLLSAVATGTEKELSLVELGISITEWPCMY